MSCAEGLYSLVECFNASTERAHNLADPPHLVKFELQLVNLTQDLMEARYLCVGVVDGIASPVVLYL